MNNFYTILFLIILLLILNQFWFKEHFEISCDLIDKMPAKIICGQRIYSSPCSTKITEQKCYERTGNPEVCSEGIRCRDYLATLVKGECIDTILH